VYEKDKKGVSSVRNLLGGVPHRKKKDATAGETPKNMMVARLMRIAKGAVQVRSEKMHKKGGRERCRREERRLTIVKLKAREKERKGCPSTEATESEE